MLEIIDAVEEVLNLGLAGLLWQNAGCCPITKPTSRFTFYKG